MENLIGKSFKTLVRTDENGNKTIEILPNPKGEEMKRTNFREVNKKLNELKNAVEIARCDFIMTASSKCGFDYWKFLGSVLELEKFRNTKIKEGI